MRLNSLPLSVTSILALGSRLSYAANPPVSQALYDKFVRYTHFSAASYASSCPNPPGTAQVVKYFDVTATSTQAFLFRDDAQSELIGAFRGTSDIQDFATDFDQTLVTYQTTGASCSGCLVHDGYQKQWNSLSADFISTLRSQVQAHPTYNITITGHSMGASLATLASASLKGSDFNVTTYTFGQPRTGNPAFADYIDQVLPQGVMYRVTHSNDGVPQTITTSAGYRHHKTEYWGNDPPSAATTVQCSGDEPPDCNNSVPGIGLGANATGINAAHLLYFGISIGNPLDPGLTECI